MDQTVQKRRRVVWVHMLTVLSAAILIGAEVFGAAFAGGWAFENLTGFGHILVGAAHFTLSLVGFDFQVSDQAGVRTLQGIFFLVGVAVMAQFIRAARRIEPFTSE